MNLFTLLNPVIGMAGLLALTLSATIAFAEVRETLKIKVKTDDGISETVTIENLADGESEVFVTESGNEVLVTRHEGGLELEVGGRVIDVKLPDVMAHSEGMHGRHVFLSDSEEHEVDGENVWIDHEDGEIRVINSSSHRVVIDTDGEDLSEEELAALIHEHAEHVDVEMDVESTVEGDDAQKVIIIKKRVITVEDETDG